MRIHLFIRSLRRDGAGSHQNGIEMIRYLLERGHHVVVHTLAGGANNPPADIFLVEHSFEWLSFRQNNRQLVRLLCQCEPEADLFVLYGVDCLWGGGAYRASGKVPVVVYLDTYLESMGIGSVHGGWYRIKRLLWDTLVGVRLANKVDVVCAVSAYIEQKYISFGIPRNKFVVIPNFFRILPAARSVRSDISVRLLYVGRLTYDKGVDLLIEALAKIDHAVAWRLRIVGAGEQESTCRALAEQLSLTDRIDFLPWMDAVSLAQEYAAADVFVHPARWPEPFGRTIVEAMSHGLPLVVPTEGAASWIAGDAALTFRNGDALDLQEAITQLLVQPDLRRRLAAVGMERAQTFDREHVGGVFEETLQRLTRSAPRTSRRERVRAWCRASVFVVLGMLAALVLFAPLMELLDTNDYNLLTKDPTTGLFLYTKNSTFETSGDCYDNKVQVNNLGLHGPPVSIQKGKDVFRILVVGSSYVAALQVPVGDMATSILEQKLNANPNRRYTYEVIPLALNQNGTFLDTLYYADYGAALNPDLVIDLETQYELIDQLDNPPLDQQGNIILAPLKYTENKKVASLRAMSRHSKLLVNLFNRVIVFQDALHTFLSNPFALTAPAPTALLASSTAAAEHDRWQRKEKLVSTFAAQVAKHHTPLLFTTWTSEDTDPAIVAELPHHMSALASEYGFSYDDLVPAYEQAEHAAGESGTFSCDPHWSAVGNRYAAEALYEYLVAHTALVSH